MSKMEIYEGRSSSNTTDESEENINENFSEMTKFFSYEETKSNLVLEVSPEIKYDPRKFGFCSPNVPVRAVPRMSNLYQLQRSKRLLGSRSSSSARTKKSSEFKPYFLVNFEFIISSILSNDDRELFNTDQIKLIEEFKSLPVDSKIVCVGLFRRKFAWISESQMAFEGVKDISLALDQLVGANLVQDDKNLEDLEDILEVLSTLQLKQILKELNLPAQSRKSKIIFDLIEHSKLKSSKFFFLNFEPGMNPIEKKIRRLAADKRRTKLYRIDVNFKNTLNLFLRLFSLTTFWQDRSYDNLKRNPQSLISLLLVDQSKIKFPSYEVTTKKKLFKDGYELIKFEEACDLEAEITEALVKNNLDLAIQKIIPKAENLFEDALNNDYLKSLPEYLRRFSQGSVLAFALTKGVLVFERFKAPEKVVALLRKLLKQKSYLPNFRGYWYDRLVVNLKIHLSNPKESLIEIQHGLVDDDVKVLWKLSLCQRVEKICRQKKIKTKFSKELDKISQNWISTPAVTEEFILGQSVAKKCSQFNPKVSGKSIFLFKHGAYRMICSVEEYVLSYYKAQMNLDGIHGEGALINSICAALYWNVIYEKKVPDTFFNTTQITPLDFNFRDFYFSRKEVIEHRSQEVLSMSEDQIKNEICHLWATKKNVTCLISWHLFKNVNHFLGMLFCFTKSQLVQICEMILKSDRLSSSGFPDLIIWNEKFRLLEIIEVKGPKDKLSNKQLLWIEFLCQIGITAKCCRVETTIETKEQPKEKKQQKRESVKMPEQEKKKKKMCDLAGS